MIDLSLRKKHNYFEPLQLYQKFHHYLQSLFLKSASLLLFLMYAIHTLTNFIETFFYLLYLQFSVLKKEEFSLQDPLICGKNIFI